MKDWTVALVFSVCVAFSLCVPALYSKYSENEEISSISEIDTTADTAVSLSNYITSHTSSTPRPSTSLLPLYSDNLSCDVPCLNTTIAPHSITRTSQFNPPTEQEAWSEALTESRFAQLLDVYLTSDDFEVHPPTSAVLGYYDIDSDGATELLYRVDSDSNFSKLYVFSLSKPNTITLTHTLNCSASSLTGVYAYNNITGFLSIDTSDPLSATVYLYDFTSNTRTELGIIYGDISAADYLTTTESVISAATSISLFSSWGMKQISLSSLRTSQPLRHYLWLSLQ
jgi:hypothetical protein